jgi:hypothetical protein
MSGNLQGFDANAVKPTTFDVLPAGEYEVAIVSSSVHPTSKGDGQYLKLEMQVLNGEFQNRKLFDQLNLWNPSAQAQEIARGTLSAICRAIGIMTPNDSTELHDKPLRVKVLVKKSDEFGEQNKIRSYKPRNGKPPTTELAGDTPTPVDANPWAKAAGERF